MNAPCGPSLEQPISPGLLNAIFEGTPDCVLVKDSELIYRAVNSAFLRFSRMSREAIIGKRDADLFPRQKADQYRQDDRRVLETGDTVVRDLCLPDGHNTRWFRVAKTPLRQNGENIEGVLVTMRDITGHYKTEESNRLHADRYATLLTTSPDGIWIVGADGEIVEANDAYCRTSGYTHEELLSLRITDLEALETPEETARHIRAVRERGFERFESRHRKIDGSVFEVEVSASYREDTGQFIAVIRDISARKTAEDALRVSEAHFEATFEQAAVGIAEVAPDGGWLRVNHRLCDILGYSQEELLSLTFQDITHPDDLEKDVKALRQMLAREIDTYSVEKRYIRKDGSSVWANLTVALTWAADSQPDYFISVVEDIQARKAAEDVLRKFSRVIEQTASTVIITNADGIIEYVNPRFSTTSGYSLKEAIGQRPSLLKSRHTSDEEYRQLWRTITSGNIWRGELLNRRKDGSLYWESVIISPIRDDHGEITHFAGIKDDITVRKRAEAALKESEWLLREAQRIGHIGSWRWDFRADAPVWSDELYRIVGRDPSLPPADYNEIPKYFTAESWGRLSTAVAKTIREGTPYEMDVQIVRSDGSRRWILARGEPVRNISGDVTELHGMMQDITERKRTEERLRDREADLRRAQTVGQIGNWRLDVRSNELIWSDEVYRIFGLPRGTRLSYHRFLAAVHPDDRDNVDTRWQAALNGEPYDIEHRVLVGSQVRWVRERAELEFDANGKPTGGFGTAQEITDRKQAEVALKESEWLLKEAQRIGHIGSWKWDVSTGVHTWSDHIYQIYGRDPTLPPAVYPEVQEYFTPESWARLSSAVEKGLAEGVPYECDAEVIRPDGTHRWITARGEAKRDADVNIIDLHGTVQDITARKQAEEEILRLNTDLERRVDERTAELTAANSELDAFAYAVSHDLRAPLRAMSGFATALIEDYSDQLEEEAGEYLERIDAASRKMNSLIEGLLTLSRSTRAALRHDRVDISALAQHLLDELAEGTPASRAETEVEAGLQVYGDARMLEAVMRNLLGNAWKYSSRVETPRIRVYAEEREGTGWICVADNGVGFDMAQADGLFQPFQRLHADEEFSGTGIGLATVQRIVQRHGGVIEAHSEPGNGAIFCISLPERETATATNE
jgi:PAS domain S-box-containing protein